MIRRPILLVAFALVAAACGSDDPSIQAPPETSSPTTTSASPSPTSDDSDRFSCEPQQGGDAESFPDFTEVKIESEGETEKVEFRFEPEGDPADAPLWFASFTDQLLTDGEGAPVDVEGEAFVAISFMARGVDLSGKDFEEIYTGPKEFSPNLTTVLEVEQTGDFEGLVSWGIGLSSEQCFAVEARPDRIIIEFPVVA